MVHWEYPNLKGFIIYIITMTKYSNITVVISLQEEGQAGEKKNGNEIIRQTEFWSGCM